MIGVQRIEVMGKRFVLVEEAEYERLCGKSGEAVRLTDDDLPPLPKPDRSGRFPALEYARMSMARDIVRDRRAAGLTQQELADSAGIRQETLSRIENGKHSASVKVIEKIDRALQRAMRKRTGKRARG
jgi:DNA-binding XRE family transcriptional regulator